MVFKSVQKCVTFDGPYIEGVIAYFVCFINMCVN